MPVFHDISLISLLENSRNKGNFAEFMEREIGYHADGSLEDRIALMHEWNRTHAKEEKTTISKNILEMESALLPILAHMESTGVRIDLEKLADIGARIKSDIIARETEIYELVNEPFNINSPKQIQEVLFGKLGIKPAKKNKTGYSVDTEVLEEIAKEYDIARLILEYRSLSKLQSTYVEALAKIADKKTGRIHTTYNQIGAATGRMSSENPNLQNIPTGVGYASEIKACFIPSEGNIFLVADYSQIELRVLAWLSEDRFLCEAFEQDEDIHARTARFLFPDQEKITSEQRRVAKTVNFWVIYGITGFGLSKTLGCSPWEADAYIKAFYEKYPGVHNYYETILEEARSLGYVETAFGRRRLTTSINDANKTIRSIAEREAINMPIQGTAADMIKLAMIDIDAMIREKNLTGKMILQVHDELVFDVPVSEKEAFEILVRECMEGVLEKHGPRHGILGDKIPPIRVDIHTGKNWVEAKG